MSPLLLGHRGSPHQFTENTLPSYQAALDAGLDGVEVDVRRLADGTLVMHHDPHLPDRRRLPQLRRAELPPHIPTLNDMLDWMAGHTAYVNVEIKAEERRPDDRVARTLDAIQERGFEKRVIVSSFSPLVLDAARQHAPEIERGFLFEHTFRCGDLDLIGRVMERTGAVALHPRFHLIDTGLMKQAKSGGWRVNTWTVNDEAEVARLIALGVDALIGNYPQKLLKGRS
ncbi:glycerophosphodiester phosphodiesterase [Deinococcus sp.]|uniref:glycerophosphodiester phosphodiesterase n=1 Tax=Deinococcus sp. TaxID=47478 RepID=UPI0025B90CE5|nr:glycerophosphodiester phosphodiesterase [Deinococcus sp.]